MTDEEQYFETRAEEWEHSRGLSRAQLLKLGAAVPLLAGASRLLSADTAGAARLADPPIRKPLPPEWFVPFGTNAEMRWDSVAALGYPTPNERFFVRNHSSTPLIDPATWRLRVFGSGLEGRRRRVHVRDYGSSLRIDDRLHRVRRQRAQLLRQPARKTRVGDAVDARRDRCCDLARRAAVASVGARGHHAQRRGRPAGGPRHERCHRRRRPGTVRRPLPVSKALDDVLIAYEMNGEPLPYDHGFPARLVVPGWIGIANIKWLGQIEVSDQPLFSPWNTTSYRLVGGDHPRLPADDDPGREVRVRARPRRASFRPAEGDARRALVVRDRIDPARRREHRSRRQLGGGRRVRQERARRLGALDVPAPYSPGRTSSGARDRRDRPGAASHRAVQHERVPVRHRCPASGVGAGLAR